MLPDGRNGLVGTPIDLSALKNLRAAGPPDPMILHFYPAAALGTAGPEGIPPNFKPEAPEDAWLGVLFAIAPEDGVPVSRYYLIDANVRKHLIEGLVGTLAPEERAELREALAEPAESVIETP